MANLNARTYGVTLVYAYVLVLLVAFIASQFGLPSFKAGYGILILGIAVTFAMVMNAQRDSRIEGKEIIYFILVLGTIIGSFFMLKSYVPELFSVISKINPELFSIIK